MGRLYSTVMDSSIAPSLSSASNSRVVPAAMTTSEIVTEENPTNETVTAYVPAGTPMMR